MFRFLTEETPSELSLDKQSQEKSSYQTSLMDEKRTINFTEEKQTPRFIQSSKKQMQNFLKQQKFFTSTKQDKNMLQNDTQQQQEIQNQNEMHLDSSNQFFMQLYKSMITSQNENQQNCTQMQLKIYLSIFLIFF